MRNLLDENPNFVVDNCLITRVHHFVTLKTADSFLNAPDNIIQSAVELVTSHVDTTVAATVRESLNFKIGSCIIPLFALVSGGSGRSLFTFKCVFESCPAFVDIRTLDFAGQIKWLVMGISHSHDFSHFPLRVPRNTIPDGVKTDVELMVTENHPCALIRMRHNLLCNNDIPKMSFERHTRG